MNELDLAVLHRAATHGMHSLTLSLDANDAITVTVAALTTTTTMRSIMRIERDVASCSFSFSEKALNNGGKAELTSHIIHCETVTDVVQLIDKFRTHIMAAYIDPERIKRHLHKYADKVDDFVPQVEQSVGKISDLDPHCKVDAVKTFSSEVGAGARAYNWPTKKEDDLPFNTDLDDEDKP